MAMKFRTSEGATFTAPLDCDRPSEWSSMRATICQSVSPDYSTCEFFDGESNPIDDSDRIQHLKYQPNSYVYCLDRGRSRPLVQTAIRRLIVFTMLYWMDQKLTETDEDDSQMISRFIGLICQGKRIIPVLFM
jgi:hypothetical protein